MLRRGLRLRLTRAWPEEHRRHLPKHYPTSSSGVLQVGVGFYHLQNGNWRGATGLLRNGTTRLKEFEPVTRGVDVTKLVSQSEHCLRQLETLGRDRISEFDESKIPRVEHKK